MRDLCLFDLDGTLVEHDTFGRLVRSRVLFQPDLAALAVARKMGVLSRAAFAEAAHRKLAKYVDPQFNPFIVSDTVEQVLPERAEVIRRWREEGAYLVLMSASPQDYVSGIGAEMGFDAAHGSHWAKGSYLHMHGVNKRAYLDEHYPVDQWSRKYCIADSPSDEAVLSCFEIAERV